MLKTIQNFHADIGQASAGTTGFRLLRRHMPELDVFRGLAILMVVMYHGFYWTERGPYRLAWETFLVKATVCGWLGVNLFFILSGFLITGILLDSRSKPTYYKAFYIKRALRILPALGATLVLALLLRQTGAWGAVLSVFFLVNYAVTLGVTHFYGPLWSLAVEEQFYLLWPTLVHRLKTTTIAAIAFGLCILEPLLRALSGPLHLGDPHQHTHLIADYLATGALLAVFARSRFATRANSILLSAALIVFGAAMLAIGVPYGILHRGNALGDALQVVPFNLIFAGALLLALALQWRFFYGRWMLPMRYLGYISYGLYLYHIMIFSLAVAAMRRLGVLQGTGDFSKVVGRFAVMSVAALAVSAVSRRWLEQPFLDMKSGLSGEGPAAATAKVVGDRGVSGEAGLSA
jgi:peptidoglycan/LPS O-acetylase OafA/YrhL